jgi:hypothetical protein
LINKGIGYRNTIKQTAQKAWQGKMDFLINPNIAYLFVVTAVMLAITTLLFPRSSLSKIGMLVCLAGAGFELFNLQANPWALVVTALSRCLFSLPLVRPGRAARC